MKLSQKIVWAKTRGRFVCSLVFSFVWISVLFPQPSALADTALDAGSSTFNPLWLLAVIPPGIVTGWLLKRQLDGGSDPLRIYQRGAKLLQSGRYRAALGRFERAIAIEPDFAQAWLGKGTAQVGLKQPEAALESLDQAISLNGRSQPEFLADLDPEDASVLTGKILTAAAWASKGDAWVLLNDTKQALKSFQQATRLDSTLTNAWLGQGLAQLALGQARGALNGFKRALALDETLAPAWAGQGNALVQLKQYKKALPSFESAQQLDARLPEIWTGQGNAYLGLSQPDDALKSFQRAIQISAADAIAWLGQGNALLKLDQPQPALRSFAQSIKLDDQSADAWFGQGTALRILGREPEAKESFKKAAELRAAQGSQIPRRLALLLPIVASGAALQWWLSGQSETSTAPRPQQSPTAAGSSAKAAAPANPAPQELAAAPATETTAPQASVTPVEEAAPLPVAKSEAAKPEPAAQAPKPEPAVESKLAKADATQSEVEVVPSKAEPVQSAKPEPKSAQPRAADLKPAASKPVEVAAQPAQLSSTESSVESAATASAKPTATPQAKPEPAVRKAEKTQPSASARPAKAEAPAVNSMLPQKAAPNPSRPSSRRLRQALSDHTDQLAAKDNTQLYSPESQATSDRVAKTEPAGDRVNSLLPQKSVPDPSQPSTRRLRRAVAEQAKQAQENAALYSPQPQETPVRVAPVAPAGDLANSLLPQRTVLEPTPPSLKGLAEQLAESSRSGAAPGRNGGLFSGGVLLTGILAALLWWRTSRLEAQDAKESGPEPESPAAKQSDAPPTLTPAAAKTMKTAQTLVVPIPESTPEAPSDDVAEAPQEPAVAQGEALAQEVQQQVEALAQQEDARKSAEAQVDETAPPEQPVAEEQVEEKVEGPVEEKPVSPGPELTPEAVQSQLGHQRLIIDSSRSAYTLDSKHLSQLKTDRNATTLDPGRYVVRIQRGVFSYWKDSPDFKGEPWVLIWIDGGTVMNKQTQVKVDSTWVVLNGYSDALAIEVIEPTTLCSLFVDTHKESNGGQVDLSVLAIG